MRVPDADPTDGTQTRIDMFAPCSTGTAVAWYPIEGGGHGWPGGEWKMGRGRMARDFAAAALIWAFYLAHPPSMSGARRGLIRASADRTG